MRIPKAIQNLIESFERLPGIGPKTAQRLTFYLLHVPQGELDKFASSVQNIKKEIFLCSICANTDEQNPCSVCEDARRDRSIVCVVEEPLDVLAIERSGKYNGLYHVLHGRIDPLNNIGPDEIYISQLLDRVKGEGDRVREIILATNPTMEGEATAMYLAKQLKAINTSDGGRLSVRNHDSSEVELKITRIGRGLPTGADLEYADDTTLQKALEGRSEY